MSSNTPFPHKLAFTTAMHLKIIIIRLFLKIYLNIKMMKGDVPPMGGGVGDAKGQFNFPMP